MGLSNTCENDEGRQDATFFTFSRHPIALITLSLSQPFFFYYIFRMIYHHLKLFSVKGQRVCCTYFSEEKTCPFLVFFFWKLTLASILLLWCGHITAFYLSAFYMTFMRDDGGPLFWDLGFII